MNKQERIILFILAALNFTNIMDFMIMMPLGPQLMRLFNINPQQFSFIVSAYTFSAFVSGLTSSLFIDKFDRKKSLMFFYTGFIIGTFLCGISQSYSMLIAARLFTGLFGGVLGATVLSIVGDIIPLERRGQAMGIVMAAFSIASVVGVPFGLFLATHTSFGWEAPFLFLALLGSPILFLIYKFIPAIDTHVLQNNTQHPFLMIKDILVERNQRKAIFLSMVMMLGHFTIIPFISPYMVANVGFSESQLQYIYLVGGLLTVFTSPLIGKLADKHGKLKVFVIFALLCTLPMFAITNMPHISIYLALCVSGIFFIFTSGRMIPMQAMVTAAVTPKYRGSFMSINSSVQQLMAGIGSFVAGNIVVKGSDGRLENYQYVGYLAITMSLLAIVIAVKLKTFDKKSF